ncbi:MAG TPA: DNA repair protein RadC [Candidatus Atribacteria bacterium]|nr:MAG: hypothetical protein DRP67_05460 [Candidatus Omnitrophota bacterium]HEC93190.1 DNA repair protein RadC [Candidatus Atribacteria bacterium]
MNNMKKKNTPHYIGHRNRLRKRFMNHGIESLQEYEVVELLLTFSIPYKDVKPIAKELISKFKSLKGIIDAPVEELKKVKYVKDKTIELIKFIKEISIYYQKQKAQEIPISKTHDELVDYCIKKMGDKKDEEFRVISLDSNLSMIADDLISQGTIDKAFVYPRKIMESALKNKAYAIILVHNHPDGKLEPSEYDINVTKALEIPAKVLGLLIYDHLIISSNGYFSFKKEGLL